MKTILIVEDDEKVTQTLRIRLKSAGYDVVNAPNGIKGLQLAQKAKPDLAILDFWMPMGSGPSMAYRLRELCPGLPFIFLTGDDSEKVRQTSSKLGAAAFFQKPYNIQELLAAIARATFMPAAPLSKPTPAREQAANGNTHPKRLLIIEDDQKISKALALRVKAAGYEVSLACDAVMGVNSAMKHKPDLVLLDISMPGGNGFAVAERIQTLAPTFTPIIFLTASKRNDFREKARELGAAGYFEKPYDSRLLLATIYDVLSGNIIENGS
jgi:DNA-binding response OmpR family regulator